MLRQLFLALVSLGVVGALAWWSESGSQEAGGAPFEPVVDWPRLPADLKLGDTVGVATDADDRVYVFHRGRRPLIVLDREGKLTGWWGDGQVKVAHGLRLDPQGNVWTTDIGYHTVMKYDRTGKILLT